MVKSESDDTCVPIECIGTIDPEKQYVENNECKECPDGFSGGSDLIATSDDTECVLITIRDDVPTNFVVNEDEELDCDVGYTLTQTLDSSPDEEDGPWCVIDVENEEKDQ